MASPAQHLPVDLQQHVQQGLHENQKAIYVSMGSGSSMPEAALRNLASVLSNLPNPVLWKLDALPGQPFE